MKKNAETFLKNVLGDDFLESFGASLSKSEIYKPGSKTIVETSDMYEGLKIVPRVLLRLLISELVPMQIGDTKEIRIPCGEDAIVRVTKHERDSLSGEVIQNNVKIVEFMHRTIPGIGLVLMSALELYDLDLLEEPKIDAQEDEINHLVDERLKLHSLINQVIDGKLLQQEAVRQMFLDKLSQLTQERELSAPTIGSAPVIKTESSKKILPLKEFIDKRKDKKNKKEFSIEMAKNENFDCPDCGHSIFSSTGFSGCICYGADMGRKVYLKKTESGIKVSFPKSWSQENMIMLLEVLRGDDNG